MIAADRPVQRPIDAKLLVLDRCGRIRHARRSSLIRFLRRGDLLVANDAATLPASLGGVHEPTGERIEVRLAGRSSLDEVSRFSAVVFGAGDFRTRTEDRPSPPRLAAGDRLRLGSLRATVVALLDHPRLVSLRFDASADAIWAGLARDGRPIQYAHLPAPLALWDVWTPIAGPPVAFEPPSAGFALDWELIGALGARGVEFATLTHAAGISSTGDPELDRRLPFDEPYRIPQATARAIGRTKAAIGRTKAMSGRIVAVGTTVVRALEHAAARGGIVRAGDGIATGRLGAESCLSVVDAVLSGTHEPGTSHYDLLGAFADRAALGRVSQALEARRYRTHEFGDSILVERRVSGSICSRQSRSAAPFLDRSHPGSNRTGL